MIISCDVNIGHKMGLVIHSLEFILVGYQLDDAAVACCKIVMIYKPTFNFIYLDIK